MKKIKYYILNIKIALTKVSAKKKFIVMLVFLVILILLSIFLIIKNNLIKISINFDYLISTLKELYYFNQPNYPYSNPPIFFSIGEAMAAIAILLAVYQFKKEKWDIALEIRKYIRSTVVTLISLGFLLVILSSLLSFIQPTNIFLLSVFWQIVSSLLIILAIIFLFLKATNKNLFNKKTKNRFVPALLHRVLSRSPKEMNLVTNTLGSNLKTILNEIKNTDTNKEVSGYTKSAHFVVSQIISNPHFSEHVITNRADFLQLFIRGISDNRLYSDNTISIAFSALIKSLFTNRDSYFYNEIKHSSPGVYYRPFLEDVFSDQELFLRLRPFDQIGFEFGEYVDIDKLKLFLEALEIALKEYFNSPREVDFESSHFRKSFEIIENALKRIMDEAKNNESKNDWPVTNKIYEITFFVGWTFRNIYRDALGGNNVSQHDLDASIENKSYGIYPKSMTSGYAKLVFNLLCIINNYPEKDYIRDYAMTLADDILIFDNTEFINIREVLLKYIWGKINGDSRSNIQGCYPTILPVFLSLVGMWQDEADSKRKELYNQTVKFLDEELKPKILDGEKMRNGDLMEKRLLPVDVKFNREKKIFEFQMSHGVQEMIVKS